MAVTLQVARSEVRQEPGIDDARIQVLLDAAVLRVNRYAPDAPEEVRDRASLLLLAFTYDGVYHLDQSSSSSFVRSGAKGQVGPWRVRRAGAVG